MKNVLLLAWLLCATALAPVVKAGFNGWIYTNEGENPKSVSLHAYITVRTYTHITYFTSSTTISDADRSGDITRMVQPGESVDFFSAYLAENNIQTYSYQSQYVYHAVFILYPVNYAVIDIAETP